MGQHHKVVIVGGGFGGLAATRELRKVPVEVTLIDRRNFHLFQPLLYQVATGALSPANIAYPLRGILKRQKNAQVLLGEVVDFDVPGRCVVLRHGQRVPYDTLVVAAGVRHNYFGHDEWEPHAPGLKTVEDATEIRRRILLAFEAAEREPDKTKRSAWLTFVIVGAGPTGVELAGALAEIARDTLTHEFRSIDPAEATILLVEGAGQVLSSYPGPLSARAAQALSRLGVTVKTDSQVTKIQSDGIAIMRGTQTEHIAARTVLWAAGVQASPLGAALARPTKTETDRAGRLIVERNLTLPSHKGIFVIGDLAHFEHDGSGSLPGIAPVANQQGRYVGRLIRQRLRGGSMPTFRYRDLGNMATIGRAAAVADLGWIRFSGYFAWLVWLFVHLMNLVNFENRLLVLMQWAWNYFTWNRSARLITGDSALPPDQE